MPPVLAASAPAPDACRNFRRPMRGIGTSSLMFLLNDAFFLNYAG
jgi:hypothetical protein